MTDSNFVVKKGLDIFDGDISLKGSNKELRFYEGANYVGFEAPALSADNIWVLPNADGSTGQALKTDGNGNLGWVTAGDATLAGTQTFTGTKSFTSEVNLNNTYGRLNFKGSNNHSIDFYNANGAALKGRITYMVSSNQMRLQANSADQLYITDGAIYPPVNNDVDLGTSSLKFKDSFFGLVDAVNFKVNGGQGDDGQVLTSTGSGVAWENAAGGGGASSLNDLSDVVISNTSNLGIGTDVFGSINTNNSTAVGYRAGQDLTTGSNNVLLGSHAGANLTVGQDNIAIGRNTMFQDTASIHSIAIGSQTAEYTTGDRNISIGSYAGRYISGNYNINLGVNANDSGSNTGSGNVVIGHNTDLADDTTDRNLIIAGYDGTNTTTWITGNSSGVVNIPGSLTVAGSAVGGASQLSDLSDVALVSNSLVAGSPSASMSGSQFNAGFGRGTLGLLSSGDNNSAIGFNALGGLNTGSNNTANGYNAGATITSGSRNTVIGYGAGDGFDTENDNIAIGYDALGGSVAGGDKNVMIGNYAGDSLSSGTENVGIGYEAHTGGSGFFNVSVGSQAGKLMTSNSYQTLVGYQAGQSFNGTNARFNTAVGYQAMGGGTSSPHQNTALGAGALYNVNGVSRNNIGIGYQAGVNQTAGSGNVIIGSGVDVASTSGSRQLVIAGNDGSTTTTWITGDSNGNVKGTDFYMVAEWNDQYFSDSLRNGKRFSFGAGMNNNTNSDSGTIGTETILPKACTLEEMHFWIGNVGAETGSGNFTVRIDKNGTELTTGYTFNMSGSGGNHVQKSFTPNVSFDAGETFNLTLHDAATSGYGSQNQIGRVRVTFRFRTNN